MRSGARDWRLHALANLWSAQRRYAGTLTPFPVRVKPIKPDTLDVVERVEKERAEKGTVVLRNSLNASGETRWDYSKRRTGVIGVKMGMTQIWNEWGVVEPATMIQIRECQVVRGMRSLNAKFWTCEVAAIDEKLDKAPPQMVGHYRRYGLGPKKSARQFKVSPDAIPPTGTVLTAAHFVPGQFVDVVGTTVGKGFQGGMKRWGFKGQPATHGVSLTHRSIGSIGSSTTPSKVWPGKKMAGRMGGKLKLIKQLQVVKIDTKLNLVYVRGSVPGKRESVVFLKDAWGCLIAQTGLFPIANQDVPYPTFLGNLDSMDREITKPPTVMDPFKID